MDYLTLRAHNLCYILATDQRISTLVKLCEAWGVEPALYHGAMDRLETIQRLAQHVVEYHRAAAQQADDGPGEDRYLIQRKELDAYKRALKDMIAAYDEVTSEYGE